MASCDVAGTIHQSLRCGASKRSPTQEPTRSSSTRCAAAKRWRLSARWHRAGGLLRTRTLLNVQCIHTMRKHSDGPGLRPLLQFISPPTRPQHARGKSRTKYEKSAPCALRGVQEPRHPCTCLSQPYMGVVENRHLTDVESPHHSPCVCTSIHTQGKSCFDLGRPSSPAGEKEY